MGEINFQRIPTWVIILMTVILIFGGLELFNLLVDSSDASNLEAELDIIRNAPVIIFIMVGIVIYIVESMLFTVIPIELSHKFTGTTWLGAMIGIILYGPLYHWSNGVFSVLVSSWLILILNSSYIILRKRSRKVAILSIIGLKIMFVFYAAFSIYSDVG